MLNKSERRLRPTDISKLRLCVGSHNDGGSLYLVVRRLGSGAWVYKFRDGAALRSKGLGALPDVTLAMARQRRDAARAGHKNEPEKPKSAGQSFASLAELYFDHHAAALGASQLDRNRALLRLYAGPLMKRAVNRITRHEIADVLRPIWSGSSNSKGMKLRTLIERILNAADNDRNPATWGRLESLLPVRSKKTKRSVPVPSLPYHQLPALYAELAAIRREEIGLTAARVLRFVILTGVRLKEARGARFSEIDYNKKLWTIPAERMKVKDKDFIVPLSDEALAVLREMQDDADAERSAVGINDGFIFPGRWSNQCIGRNAIHLALDRLQGDEDEPRWVDVRARKITTHGFRSTMATWAQEQRSADGIRLFDQETIDGALAHFAGGVTGAYQRSQHLDARRKLASAWGEFASTPQPNAPLAPDVPNRVEATKAAALNRIA